MKSDKDQIDFLIKALIKERRERILFEDRAYPEAGFGKLVSYAERQAVEQLKKEKIIPSDYAAVIHENKPDDRFVVHYDGSLAKGKFIINDTESGWNKGSFDDRDAAYEYARHLNDNYIVA